MKIGRFGKIKLESGEIRVGNFFIREESDGKHIKATDLNSCFTLRIRRAMPVGMWLCHLTRRGDAGLGSIRTYLAVMWSVMSAIPDDEYVKSLMEASKACMSRHPEWYGPKEVSKDGD